MRTVSQRRYDFDKHHDGIKEIGVNVDQFMYGLEPFALLLFFGDLKAARTGFAKVNDAHRRVLQRVKQGVGAVDGYQYEILLSLWDYSSSLLIAGELQNLRDFLGNSLAGALVSDEAIGTSFKSALEENLFSWKTDEGYRAFGLDADMLIIRSLMALLEQDTDASRSAIREWLPSSAELLHVAEFATIYMAYLMGASHPALLCSRLYGERLGNWNVTAEVMEGILRIEQFNPILRTEAHRLLGRAKAELGDSAAACEAAELAVAEAAGAKYLWLEMLSLRDLLKWSDADKEAGVRARLHAVIGRMSASAEELAALLGEGVLHDIPVPLTVTREVRERE